MPGQYGYHLVFSGSPTDGRSEGSSFFIYFYSRGLIREDFIFFFPTEWEQTGEGGGMEGHGRLKLFPTICLPSPPSFGANGFPGGQRVSTVADRRVGGQKRTVVDHGRFLALGFTGYPTPCTKGQTRAASGSLRALGGSHPRLRKSAHPHPALPPQPAAPPARPCCDLTHSSQVLHGCSTASMQPLG